MKKQYNDQRHAEIVVEVIYVMGHSSHCEGLLKNNAMVKVKTYKKQRSTKHSAENQRSSKKNPTKNRG